MQKIIVTTQQELKDTILEVIKESQMYRSPEMKIKEKAISNRPLESDEAAAYLGKSIHTIRQYAASGKIKSSRRGRKYIFYESDLEAWKAGKPGEIDDVKAQARTILKNAGKKKRYGK